MMEENKFKKIIGAEYTDNPIINYLKYWSIGNTTYPTSEKIFREKYEDLLEKNKKWLKIKQDEWRKKYDLDVIWLKGDLKADTIFSVWMPLKMCLQCSATYPYSFKGNNCYPYKKDGYKGKQGIINFLTDIKTHIDTYLPKGEWLDLYEFAELASTRANVMKLPDRGMQTRGIKEFNFGKWKVTEPFFDQMPRTLYECFEGGEFQKRERAYFKNDNEVIRWVEDEKLTSFFDEKISRETIKPLIGTMKPSQVKWITEKNELNKMLGNYIDILKIRKQQLL